MGITDYIKIDFMTTNMRDREYSLKKYGKKHINFIAEKVETKEEFDSAVKIGYSLFQGYFFSKPTTIVVKEIPPFKLYYLQLMKDVYQAEPDMKRIAKAIEKDLSLLVIEIDGRIHEKLVKKEYDIIREYEIKARNIRILRFTNEQIKNDINEVLYKIKNKVLF